MSYHPSKNPSVPLIWVCFLIIFATGCNDTNLPGLADSLDKTTIPVQVIETSPEDNARDIELDTYIQATFSATIDTATVNESTFIVRQDTSVIPGTFTFADSITTFIPAEELQREAFIDVTISSEVADIEGNLMELNYEWEFTTRLPTTEESIPPTITKTDPPHGAIEVSTGTDITAHFSKPLNPTTVNNNTFLLRLGNSTISGSVDYDDKTAIFDPSGPLEEGETYTITVTDGVEDQHGNALTNTQNWNFTTIEPDRTPPTITVTDPPHGAVEVSTSTDITARFSEPLNPTTVNSSTFLLRLGNSNISGSVDYNDETAVFDPSDPLQEGETYTVTITDDIEDRYGNALTNTQNWNFTTKEPDRTPPQVIDTNPNDDEDDVPVDIKVTATFNEAMDPATINRETFALYERHRGQYRQISGSVNYSGTTAQFNPSSNLRDDKDYIAIIRSDVTDLAGNTLGDSFRWSFETDDDD